jgi:hypothetical protein
LSQRNIITALFARSAKVSILFGSALLLILDWLALFNYMPPIVSLLLRAFIMSICLGYIFITGINFGKYSFGFGNALAFFIMVNIIYSLLSSSIISDIYYTSRILMWTSISVAVYRLILFGDLREYELRNFIYLIIVIGSVFTLYYMALPDVEGGQNASAYTLLWSIPMALLFPGRFKLKWIIVGLATLAIIVTIKRGAIVALIASASAYYIYLTMTKSSVSKFLTATLSFLLLIAIGYFAVMSNLEGFESRFSDTSGSGRDILYVLLLTHWLGADTITQIFGFGINSVQQYTSTIYFGAFSSESGVYAHSDWIQLIHDFGLIGFMILFWIHLSVLRLILDGHKMGLEYTPALLMGYIILFLVNIYSGHLFAPGAFLFGILVAYCATKLRLAQQEIIVD